MADNFLEYHREEYEHRKAEWLRRKKRLHTKTIRSKAAVRPTPHATISRPDDEAL